MSWLARASRQPGKALHVAIALWFVAGLTKTSQVKLSRSVLDDLGVDRHAGYRGLSALETAGLVRVVRHRGRQPVVTLLEVRGECERVAEISVGASSATLQPGSVEA